MHLAVHFDKQKSLFLYISHSLNCDGIFRDTLIGLPFDLWSLIINESPCQTCPLKSDVDRKLRGGGLHLWANKEKREKERYFLVSKLIWMRLFELRNIFGVEKFDVAVKMIPFNFHIPCPLLNCMLSFSFHFHIIWKKAIIHKLLS